jgi:hypothetical protein
MFELHWHHPFMVRGTGAAKPAMLGEPKLKFPRPAGHRDDFRHCVRPWIQTIKWRIEFPILGN